MKLNLYASKNCQGPSIQAFACSEGLSSFLVLRVSFTLFNLQGARRSAERCYYTGSSGRLSSLFSTFFADHFRSCETARLDYHIFMPFVKYFFQSLNFPLTSPRPLSRTASLEYQPFPLLSTLFVLLFSLLLIFSINHPYIGGASGQFYNTRQKTAPAQKMK